MSNELTRKIQFFRIFFKKNDNLVDPNTVFSHLESLPYTVDGRYMPIGNGNMRSLRVLPACSPLSIVMGTTRKNGLPYLEKNGDTSPLIISDDEGLYEPTHSVIFPNNVLGTEYNHYGPRVSGLKGYIEKKAPDLVDQVEIFPLMKKDFWEELSRIGEIKAVTIRVHRDWGNYLRELDETLHDALAAVKRGTDAPYIELVLKSEGRDSITVSWWDRLYSWISNSENTVGVSDFKVRAVDTLTDKVNNFDLLEEYITSTKRVIKNDEHYRCVNEESMQSAIVDSYRELNDEIMDVIDEEPRNA